MDEQPQNQGSILDRVLQSQQEETLEHFEPLEIVNELLKQLSAKEADVLRRRFGLGQKEAETLEEIGKGLNVTRERVRQIQHWAIDRLKKSATTATVLRHLDALLQQLLEERGGVMLEEDLLGALHARAAATDQARAATLFILTELMTDKLERVENDSYKPYWKMKYAAPKLLDGCVAEAVKIITAAGQPMSWEDVLKRLHESSFWTTHAADLTPVIALAYVSVSRLIERNPYGEYGLRNWGSVMPRRMNDKILLVLRKHGQPMHFMDITKKINETGFDKRQAYPPTVHNELILSKEYVLVGRGIYALKEWGYKPGVVADVLADILKDAGQPLTRDELVAKVLEQRMVKRNTIHLALTNKQRFSRLPDGRYTLAVANQAPTPNP